MNQDTPLRLGVVGLGRVTSYYWPALETIPGLRVAGVCDRDHDKVTLWNQTSPHCPAFTDLQALAEQVNPDAFVVATTSSTHYAVTQALLPFGKPILLEKPATSSAAEFQRLITQVSTHQIPLIVAFHNQFSRELEWFLEQKNALEQSFGKITGFFSGFYDPYGESGTLKPHANSLISSWLDSGVNALSMIVKILDSLEIIESHFTKFPSHNDPDIHGYVQFSFAVNSGDRAGRGAIETHWGLGINHKKTRWQFGQTGYEILCNHNQEQVILIDPQGQSEILANCSGTQPRMVAHYQGVFQDFYHHCQQGTHNLALSQQIHHLLYQAYESPYNLSLNPK